MSDGQENSRGRWWEIPGEGQPTDEGHRELMTDSRGRSRPERSLSAGADLAEDPQHPARAFLWPTASVVVAAGLILSVVYGVSRSKPASPANATAAAPATRSAAPQDDMGVKQDAGVKSVVPPVRQGSPPADGGGVLAPIGPQSVIPKGPVAVGGPAGAPAAPIGAPPPPATVPPNVSPGAAAGDASDPPAGTATSTPAAAPQDPPVKLDGPAPDAPGLQQKGKPEAGTGGCEPYNSKTYVCNIAREAPIYAAGTRKRKGPVPAGQYHFQCQSAGSRYSVGDRTDRWWASVKFFGFWFWVPVAFLSDAPDNGPEPGLPVCDNSAQASTDDARSATTAPHAPSSDSTPTTTMQRVG
ncbi:MAG: hypothetical protein ACRDRS_12650 [Pseudonocardiaceae bacterium]